MSPGELNDMLSVAFYLKGTILPNYEIRIHHTYQESI